MIEDRRSVLALHKFSSSSQVHCRHENQKKKIEKETEKSLVLLSFNFPATPSATLPIAQLTAVFVKHCETLTNCLELQKAICTMTKIRIHFVFSS